MAFNFLGDLYKTDIVEKVKENGINMKNVRELNKVLEEMGILEHIGNSWLTTEKGVNYTVYSGKVYDADGWHPSIVGEICKYLLNK